MSPQKFFAPWSRAAENPYASRRYEHAGLPDQPAIREIQLHRFDEYGVVYSVIRDTFWVLAVAHAKRRPGYWITRVAAIP